jgi:hypothetical protein
MSCGDRPRCCGRWRLKPGPIDYLTNSAGVCGVASAAVIELFAGEFARRRWPSTPSHRPACQRKRHPQHTVVGPVATNASDGSLVVAANTPPTRSRPFALMAVRALYQGGVASAAVPRGVTRPPTEWVWVVAERPWGDNSASEPERCPGVAPLPVALNAVGNACAYRPPTLTSVTTVTSTAWSHRGRSSP